jgi:CRP-like cAMP-binding protein
MTEMIESEYLGGDSGLIEKLRKMSTLKDFQVEHLKGMLRLSKIRKYDPEELIIEEGANDSWVYFLVSGKVRVVKHGVEINILDQTGDVFGEMGILDSTPRSASIYAMSETVCLSTDASYLDRLPDNDRIAFTCILYHVFAELLSNRLKAMNEELVKVKEENLRLKSQLDKPST